MKNNVVKLIAHSQAVGELKNALRRATGYLNSCSKQAEDEKGRLRVIEERVADYNREIESYRSAIRVLGGDPDEQPAKK
jgi:hypothetical protein